MKKNIFSLTKKQLIDTIQEQEETKFDLFKTETGMPYNTDEEWVNYIKKIQDLNAERLKDCEELTNQLTAFRLNFDAYLRSSGN
jgi:hypothetical protein